MTPTTLMDTKVKHVVRFNKGSSRGEAAFLKCNEAVFGIGSANSLLIRIKQIFCRIQVKPIQIIKSKNFVLIL